MPITIKYQTIATDSNGNLYLIINWDFYSDAFLHYYHTSISKINTTGDLVWTVNFESQSNVSNVEGRAIALDPQGNVYVGGQCEGDISFGGNLAQVYEDMFLAKIDNNGNLLWVKAPNNSESQAGFDFHYPDRINDIAIDNSGNIYATGQFGNSITIDGVNLSETEDTNGDYFLLKFDSNGNALWGSSAGGILADYGQTLTVNSSGEIYVAGHFAISISFAGTSYSFESQANYDYFLAKYNSNGSIAWVKPANSPFDLHANDLTLDNSGNLYLTGDYEGAFVFDNNYSITSVAGDDKLNPQYYLMKLTANGVVQWAHVGIGTVGPTARSGKAVAINNNDVYVAGDFGGIMQFDNGDQLIGDEVSSLFVAKYDLDGNYKGYSRTNNVESSFSGDYCYAMDIYSNGDIWVCGEADGKIALDEKKEPFAESSGNSDGLLWYICSDDIKTLSSSTEDYSLERAQNLVSLLNANPFKDELSIKVNQRNNSKITLSLFNSAGKLVWRKAIEQGQVNIPLHHIADGIYFLNATSEKGSQTIKLVKD